MITNVHSIMIYVENPKAVAAFWINQVGFTKLSESTYMPGDDTCYIELKPTDSAITTITLHDKAFVGKMQPSMNLGTPSMLFKTDDISALHAKLKANNVAVGDIMDMGGMVTFNFPDPEGNYFAICE